MDQPEPRHIFQVKRNIVAPPPVVVDVQRPDRTAAQAAEIIPWRLGAAVLIGVWHGSHLPSKPAIRNNIESLSSLLHEGFGIPSPSIKVLENPEYSEHVQRAVDVAMRSVDPVRGGFLLYYAGHGWTDSQTGQLLLSLPNSDPSKNFTALRFNSLREQIADSNIPARLVILDSCYSGAALDSLAGDIASSTAIEGTYVMTSSSATNRSRALDTDHYTTFTGELINTLNHGIPNAPEILTASVTYRYIRDICNQRGWPEPLRSSRCEGENLPLMRNAWNQSEHE
ncbi:caspase domain-containing protein [Streptomyces sioyaensis]|uniref:caspase family protein n=1 Tax=Streptomyces sioyaensis TaxID=67364 RepID=UPI0036A11921